MSIINITNNLKEKLKKCTEYFQEDLNKINIGKAHPNILSKITIESYGVRKPINAFANIIIINARTLSVTPWDKSNLIIIEKAILKSNLDLNPKKDSNSLIIHIPQLSEERRKSFIKLAKIENENYKIKIRNIRRKTMSQIKDALNNKDINEDDSKMLNTLVQNIINKSLSKIDILTIEKEKLLMQI